MCNVFRLFVFLFLFCVLLFFVVLDCDSEKMLGTKLLSLHQMVRERTHTLTEKKQKHPTHTCTQTKKQKAGGKQIPCYYVEIITSDNNECSRSAHTHSSEVMLSARENAATAQLLIKWASEWWVHRERPGHFTQLNLSA